MVLSSPIKSALLPTTPITKSSPPKSAGHYTYLQMLYIYMDWNLATWALADIPINISRIAGKLNNKTFFMNEYFYNICYASNGLYSAIFDVFQSVKI